jgi:hypothetical protein
MADDSRVTDGSYRAHGRTNRPRVQQLFVTGLGLFDLLPLIWRLSAIRDTERGRTIQYVWEDD